VIFTLSLWSSLWTTDSPPWESEVSHTFMALKNIIRVVKFGRIKSAGHSARMGELIHTELWSVNEEYVGIKCLNWINLAQDRDQWRTLENMVIATSLTVTATVTLMGRYRTRRPIHCDHFLIYCAFSILSFIRYWFIHHSSLTVTSSEAERNLSRNGSEFCRRSICFMLRRVL
jgi:hypothetical protein